MVHTFSTRPRDFEGGGIFQPVSVETAELVEVAGLPQVAAYLQRLTPLRLRLAHALRGQTLPVYPVNELDVS